MSSKRAPARPPSAAFDAHAAAYDAGYESETWRGAWLRARLAAVADAVGPGRGRALDVGVGPGRLAAVLDERGWTVSGADPSEVMLERARARLPDAAHRFLAGRAESLPFPDGHFDVVTMVGVLRFVDELAVAFAEAARVTAPGGRLVLALGNPWAPVRVGWLPRRLVRPREPGPAAVVRPGLDARYWRPRRVVVDGLRESGWRLESVVPAACGVVPEPLDRLAPGLAVRLASWAERRGPRLRRVLATQLVLVARRLS